MLKISIVAVLCAAAIAPSASLAAGAPAAVDAAVRATLANGMHVVVLRDDLAPVATTLVMYGVGSNDDAMPGIAHATEHMLFRGTTDVSAGQFADIATRMGAQYNAQTTNEYTLYWFKMPAPYVGVALRLEADRMTRAAIRPQDWATERGAIEQEIRAQESQPGSAIGAKVRTTFFNGTPFAKTIGGTVESFEKMTASDIRSFYAAWYAPGNATLIVSGDVDPQATMRSIHALFDGIPAKLTPPRSPIVVPPLAATTIEDTMDFPVGFGVLAYRLPGSTEADYAAALVLDTVLDSGRGQFADLQAQHKLLAAASFSSAFPEAGASFLVAIPTQDDTPQAALSLVSGVIDAYRVSGVPADLVEAAKMRILAQSAFARASISGLGFAWADAISHRFDAPDSLFEAITQVQPADVDRVLDRYFAPEHQMKIVVAAKPTAVLARPDSNAGVENVAYTPSKAEPLPAWASSALRAPLRAPRDDRSTVTRRLSNGLLLRIRHESAAPAVFVTGSIRNDPQLYVPQGKDGTSMILGMLLPWGTTAYDRTGYQAQLDKIAATVNLGFDFNLTVQSQGFDRGMELLADGMLHPAFDPAAFAVVKANAQQSVAIANAQPSEKADLAERLALYPPGDPRRRDVTVSTVQAISLADVERYYRFAARPDLTQIAIVGDVTPDQAVAAAQKYFGAWKAQGRKPDFKYPAIASRAPKAASVTVRSVTNVQSQVTLKQVLRLQRGDADLVPLLLANTILSGEGTGSMLFQDMRTRRGYVYEVSSDVDVQPEGTEFSITYASDPRNVDRAESSALAIIRRLQREPLPAVELQRAKASLVAAKVLPLDSYAGVATYMLADAGGSDGPFAGVAERVFWKELLATTPAQLEHAMRSIDAGRFTRVVVAPGS